MIRLLAVLVLAGASVNGQTVTETFGTGANQFSIDFVTIGNPGNAADTTGDPNSAGRVDYVYNLGKNEISRNQIEKANTAGGLGITLADLSSYGGNGSNRPATGIGWNEAARFVNWLNTSKGYHVAYNFTTSGANDNITIWSSGQYIGNNQFRHKDAYYFLPSVDEWYKGAYYDPNKAGGAGYWSFATGSSSAPMAVNGGTSGSVYMQSWATGPADVTNAGGLSPYGTMGQGGNVWEWNESAFDGTNSDGTENREMRGGAWVHDSSALQSSYRSGDGVQGLPWNDTGPFVGFRIGSVPEPSSFSLLLAGGAVFLGMRNTRKIKI